jgi:hypothetical protein
VAVQWLAGRAPDLVERLFSRGLYPLLGGAIGCAAALVPFSVAEIGLVAAVLAALVWTWRRLRDGLRRSAVRSAALALLADALLAAGAVYVVFLVLWGLNYRRLPFATIAGLDASPGTVAELDELSASLVAEANRHRASVGEDAAGVMRLRGGARGAWSAVAAGWEAASRRIPALGGRCARPKLALLSPIMARFGITGIYSPFTGEPHVNATLPDSDLPLSAAHEVAHARGFAREDEANYLAYLACRSSPDPDLRYAALLGASLSAQNALYGVARGAYARIEARRSPAVRRDIAALVAWSKRYEGPATAVGEKINDAYLKAQGEKAGVRSYGRMVDLLLAERRGRSPGAPLGDYGTW